VYTNVTVTSITRTDVCIFHAGGICNLKLSDLRPESLQQLANANVPKPAGLDLTSPHEGSAGPFAAGSQMTETAGQLNAQLSSELLKLRSSGAAFIVGFLVVAAVMYLFFCYCFSLICKKAGHEPGILIWLPIVQLFPMLRAAGMSPLWFLVWLVPGLSVIAHVVWCINITKAREKSGWVALFLILPLTNLFALLFLAFSNDESENEVPLRNEPMVLEGN
jgi:hypothetical protein